MVTDSSEGVRQAVRRELRSLVGDVVWTVVSVYCFLTGLFLFEFTGGISVAGVAISTLTGVVCIGLAVGLFILVWNIDKWIVRQLP
jgi:uncharacterized membrane protein